MTGSVSNSPEEGDVVKSLNRALTDGNYKWTIEFSDQIIAQNYITITGHPAV